MFKYSYIIPLVLLIAFFSCKTTAPSPSIYKHITSHYSTQEINDFYELMFNSEWGQKIYKWKKDTIYYKFKKGDSLQGDAERMARVAAYINQLGLPVKCASTNKIENVKIKEIDSIKLEKVKKKYGDRWGQADTKPYFGAIRLGTVELKKNIPLYLREEVYLHEFIHILGLSSHTTTTMGGTMYCTALTNGKAPTERELRSLQLLYDSIIPNKMTCKDFETIFANELYHINSIPKLVQLVKDSVIDKRILTDIYEHGMRRIDTASTPELQLYKLANACMLQVGGDVPEGRTNALQSIVGSINQCAPNLKLKVVDSTNANAGIVKINFKADTTVQPQQIYIAGFTSGAYEKYLKYQFRPIYYLSTTIYYNPKHVAGTWQLFGNMLYSLLSLGASRYYAPAFEVTNGQLVLKPYYQQLLTVFYSPHLPHNFTKTQMEKVIEMLH